MAPVPGVQWSHLISPRAGAAFLTFSCGLHLPILAAGPQEGSRESLRYFLGESGQAHAHARLPSMGILSVFLLCLITEDFR